LLIGCGSLGGYVAHLLSRAGVGRLTLTDNDCLGWENLGRHILGASSIGRWKAGQFGDAIPRAAGAITALSRMCFGRDLSFVQLRHPSKWACQYEPKREVCYSII
jgi:tRNA A37 threonylcarbamoyladenosine dehydratase